MTLPNEEATGVDRRSVWHLGSTQRRAAVNPRTFNVGAPIADSEYHFYRANIELLEQSITKSPFASLQERCMDFMQATSTALEAWKSGQPTTTLTPAIHGRFDDLLSAFRRFTDRTAHLLSERYGPDSEEVAILRQATSEEFDNEFAYRFMYQLRNYSDHRDAPITRVSQVSKLMPDGQVEQELDVLFDSRALLSYHGWQRQVRADLARIDGEFSLVVTVDALLHACGRVHCKVLLAQETSISRATAGIRALTGQIAVDDDFGPVLLQIRHGQLTAGQITSPFNVIAIRTDLPEVADMALRQAREVLRA